VNSEDTISWAIFGLVCRRRWAGISMLALHPDYPRPNSRIVVWALSRQNPAINIWTASSTN